MSFVMIGLVMLVIAVALFVVKNAFVFSPIFAANLDSVLGFLTFFILFIAWLLMEYYIIKAYVIAIHFVTKMVSKGKSIYEQFNSWLDRAIGSL